MSHAVIDIGANSAKMVIGAFEQGDLKVEIERMEVSRLGEGLHETGTLSAGGMERTRRAVERFVEEARRRKVTSIVAVGTLGLRRAENAPEFLRTLRETTGLTIEVISGEEEARLSFVAALSATPVAGRVCVFDIGGGSTELVHGRGGQIESRRSVELGARVATDRFLRSDPPAVAEVQALRSWLDGEFGELDGAVDDVIGVGGTVTTLAAVALDIDRYAGPKTQGFRLAADEVERQIHRYQAMTLQQRQHVRGLLPERADVILAGACVVATLLRKLNKPAMAVSHRGLRHGVFLDRFADGDD